VIAGLFYWFNALSLFQARILGILVHVAFEVNGEEHHHD
jgi:hypothetical protein